MSPLVAMTLTAFGGLVVLALLIWSLLMPRQPPQAPPPTADGPRPTPVSNDDVRGARVRPARRPRSDDPFEQFLRADGDER